MPDQQFRVFFSEQHGACVVKSGFSWPACLFNLYWAMAKGLWWLVAVILVCVFGGLMLFAGAITSFPRFGLAISLIVLAAEIAGVVYLGKRGNEWVASRLEGQGFELRDVVTAADAREARCVAAALVRSDG